MELVRTQMQQPKLTYRGENKKCIFISKGPFIFNQFHCSYLPSNRLLGPNNTLIRLARIETTYFSINRGDLNNYCFRLLSPIWMRVLFSFLGSHGLFLLAMWSVVYFNQQKGALQAVYWSKSFVFALFYTFYA